MTDDANTEGRKLFVDEDWKGQVEREREAARHAEEPAAASPEKTATSAGAAEPLPMPPADLLFLIGTLYLQGAIALGLMPNPMSSKAEVQRDRAKHTIDLLAMLQEKTEGNRTPEESTDLDNVLYQLRMAFVTVSESADTKN